MKQFSSDWPIIGAAALVKPRMTGCEARLINTPMRNRPGARRRTPTSRASSMESWISSSLPRLARGSMAAADISDNIATGPVCRKRDAPRMDATITGKNDFIGTKTCGTSQAAAYSIEISCLN